MTLFNSYLSSTKVKKVLSTNPGQEGFSLIELVVVVAVLAVLSAIAIPAFTDISNRAKTSAATNTLATIAKECAVKLATVSAANATIIVPDLDGYKNATVSGSSNNAGFRHGPSSVTSSTGTVTFNNNAKQGTTGTNYLAPGATYTCLANEVYGFASDNLNEYPHFWYNHDNGAKYCEVTAGQNSATGRGCDSTTNW